MVFPFRLSQKARSNPHLCALSGFYKLSYTHRGKSTTQFIRPHFVGEVRQQLATYKKFKALTQKWVALALQLSKLELQEARSAAPKPTRNQLG
jgi:hypothetical protein